MEGPKEIIIPEQRYVSCSRCKYYNQSMVKSGNHPIYSYNCNHPAIEQERLIFTGNLHKNVAGVVETPDWCPYLKSGENAKDSKWVCKDCNGTFMGDNPTCTCTPNPKPKDEPRTN